MGDKNCERIVRKAADIFFLNLKSKINLRKERKITVFREIWNEGKNAFFYSVINIQITGHWWAIFLSVQPTLAH